MMMNNSLRSHHQHSTDFPVLYSNVLKTNNYLVGEFVVKFIWHCLARVERWNSTTEELIVSSSGEFNAGSKTITGRSSDTESVIESKLDFNIRNITTGAGSLLLLMDGKPTLVS